MRGRTTAQSVLRSTERAWTRDAQLWIDLAAAGARAMHSPPRDAALRIDPQHSPALFNRALIVERLGLRDQARDAWKKNLVESIAAHEAQLATTPREFSAQREHLQWQLGRPEEFSKDVLEQMIRLMRRDLRAGKRIVYDEPALYARATVTSG